MTINAKTLDQDEGGTTLTTMVSLPNDLMNELDYAIDMGLFKSRPDAFYNAITLLTVQINANHPIYDVKKKTGDIRKNNIDFFRNYIFIDHCYVKKYGRKESKNKILVSIPIIYTDFLRKSIKEYYEYDDVSLKDLLKYSLIILLHVTFGHMIPNVSSGLYYTFSNKVIDGEVIEDVTLNDEVLKSLYKNYDCMYIGSKGAPKCIINGVLYRIEKPINKGE